MNLDQQQCKIDSIKSDYGKYSKISNTFHFQFLVSMKMWVIRAGGSVEHPKQMFKMIGKKNN